MSNARTATILALSLGMALVGCTKPSATKTAAVEPTADTTSAPVPKPVFSVNEQMVMIVDHPGELLWDVEKPGHAPKTDEAWYQLEDHAVELASAATLIQLGGTGPADAGWAKQPLWQSSAQNLVSAALKARQAAHAHDLPTLIAANGDVVAACEACHKQFKPDIPTGGLFMHHRPGTH
jgi:cytochrome c556